MSGSVLVQGTSPDVSPGPSYTESLTPPRREGLRRQRPGSSAPERVHFRCGSRDDGIPPAPLPLRKRLRGVTPGDVPHRNAPLPHWKHHPTASETLSRRTPPESSLASSETRLVLPDGDIGDGFVQDDSTPCSVDILGAVDVVDPRNDRYRAARAERTQTPGAEHPQTCPAAPGSQPGPRGTSPAPGMNAACRE